MPKKLFLFAALPIIFEPLCPRVTVTHGFQRGANEDTIRKGLLESAVIACGTECGLKHYKATPLRGYECKDLRYNPTSQTCTAVYRCFPWPPNS
ncbi:MAG: hypothetical protein HYR96_04495 [Deltaproteobacteria bacterium]|nr:hypothetical protein [Deltaproteobacteria bacterium]MBI3295021.1 hypothetical protein [Deltaproteobacteria bacterium]